MKQLTDLPVPEILKLVEPAPSVKDWLASTTSQDSVASKVVAASDDQTEDAEDVSSDSENAIVQSSSPPTKDYNSGQNAPSNVHKRSCHSEDDQVEVQVESLAISGKIMKQFTDLPVPEILKLVEPAPSVDDSSASTTSQDSVASKVVAASDDQTEDAEDVSSDSENAIVQSSSPPAKDHNSGQNASSNVRKRSHQSVDDQVKEEKVDFGLRILSTLTTSAPDSKSLKMQLKPPASPRSIMEQIIDAFVFDVMGIDRKFDFDEPLLYFKCNWKWKCKFPEPLQKNDPVYKKTENDDVYKKTFREIFNDCPGLISVKTGDKIKPLSQLVKLSNEELASEKLSFDTPVVVCFSRSISFKGKDERVWFYRVVGRLRDWNLDELPEQTVGTFVSKWQAGECITSKPILPAAHSNRRLSDGTHNGLDVADSSNWDALHGNTENFLCPQYNPITNALVVAPNVIHVADESYATSSVVSGSTVAQNLLICASLATAAVVIGVLARKAWKKIQRNAARRRRLPSPPITPGLPIPPTPQPANSQGETHQNESVDLDRESRNPDPTFLNGSQKK
eukprot:GHVT01033667.1.p1 GENE.GHVT01033667.1~~GHVT01033667.1.p1  ORF type:complete len:564 (+),score=76.45 GHVT01033667.1:1822-3513(+)